MLRDLFSLFPAYAGVILSIKDVKQAIETFPRIRGGDPYSAVPTLSQEWLFPAYAGVILRNE